MSLLSKFFTVAAAATISISGVALKAKADIGQDESGAKGLFFEQLQKPNENLNTGLRYWIELKRGNIVTRVNNKQAFRTGDSIRFHVRSNIDGYAYILLSSGSRGEQAVLFPDAAAGESNKVNHGKEYILPGNGYLTFDENPGVEKLTLLLSREPMDAQAYLSKPKEAVTMIACADSGSKDLVPTKIYVAYNPPKPEVQLIASQPTTEKVEKSEKSEKSGKSEKSNKTESATKTGGKTESHSGGKTGTKSDTAKSKVKTSKVSEKTSEKVSEHPHTTHVHHTPVANSSPASQNAGGDDEGTTTVVSQESSGILHVDVALQHI